MTDERTLCERMAGALEALAAALKDKAEEDAQGARAIAERFAALEKRADDQERRIMQLRQALDSKNATAEKAPIALAESGAPVNGENPDSGNHCVETPSVKARMRGNPDGGNPCMETPTWSKRVSGSSKQVSGGQENSDLPEKVADVRDSGKAERRENLQQGEFTTNERRQAAVKRLSAFLRSNPDGAAIVRQALAEGRFIRPSSISYEREMIVTEKFLDSVGF